MLSFVIPVYNEEESLAELHRQIDAVGRENHYDVEFIFVDDGSRDRSWGTIGELAARDERVRGIRFRRNFGKAAALSAGFAAARGEIIFTLDADLQDNPVEIPRFLEKMQSDCDVVSGWKKVRHDPWHKVLPSRIFNWMVSRLTGVHLHDHNCGFKCYRREIFDEIDLYGELHRFVPVLAGARGWRAGEIVVEHRARQHGRSKYGLLRIPKGFLDLMTVKFITGYGQRPQHMLGATGMIFFFIGAIIMFYLTAMWFITRLPWLHIEEPLSLTGRALFFYALGALILGSQFITVGFLAELLTAHDRRRSKPYSIAEHLGTTPPASEEGAGANEG
jgi:glycosyltransferase involved in cell wall biosynthesis